MKIDREALLIKGIKQRFGPAILETTVERGEITHVVDKDSIFGVCSYLKNEPDLRMDFLVDVLGVDHYPERPRFEVVYHIRSLKNNLMLRLKTRLDETETIRSVTPIWRAANWAEREAYDMFGIVFDGHPDLRRIYMPEDWDGFPLRKDYPLRGYKDQYNPFGEDKK